MCTCARSQATARYVRYDKFYLNSWVYFSEMKFQSNSDVRRCFAIQTTANRFPRPFECQFSPIGNYRNFRMESLEIITKLIRSKQITRIKCYLYLFSVCVWVFLSLNVHLCVNLTHEQYRTQRLFSANCEH